MVLSSFLSWSSVGPQFLPQSSATKDEREWPRRSLKLLQETVREKIIVMEKEHMLAVDALEATFEKRLQLQKQESTARLATMDDKKFYAEETLQRVHRACAGRLWLC